ncbi:FkbM family methyltransferase, partial [Pyrobaculum sp.]|uniref:FkbM family methyltransferase n=1 Tax=Pyrobaculum sp. TaxID=2004705 RepID=UPI003D10903B
MAVAADAPSGGSPGRPAHPPPPTPPLDRVKRIYINLLNALFGRTTTLEVGPLSLHVFSDGFGSIEENIFSNIYFTDGEIRDAGAVIDLGAHHCSFSVYVALKSSPGSAVVAVEPNPLAAELCAENLSSIRWLIKRKRLRVKILRGAVWRSEGDIYLELSWWSEAHTVGDRPRGRWLRVKAFTLDEILKEAGGDAIVKMDIEGRIRGAEELKSEGRAGDIDRGARRPRRLGEDPQEAGLPHGDTHLQHKEQPGHCVAQGEAEELRPTSRPLQTHRVTHSHPHSDDSQRHPDLRQATQPPTSAGHGSPPPPNGGASPHQRRPEDQHRDTSPPDAAPPPPPPHTHQPPQSSDHRTDEIHLHTT